MSSATAPPSVPVRREGSGRRHCSCLRRWGTTALSPMSSPTVPPSVPVGGGGQWKKALQLFEEMRNNGIVPNVISYNATISACEKGGEWKKALQLFQEMRNNGIQSDVISYKTIIGVCFNSCKYKEALELLQEGQSNGHFPKFSQQRSGTWDLHGFPLSVSCMLLYEALQFLVETKSQDPLSFRQIIVVTGKGLGSGPEGPVLQRGVPNFLTEISGPKITRIEGNDGAFLLHMESLQDWSRSTKLKAFKQFLSV